MRLVRDDDRAVLHSERLAGVFQQVAGDGIGERQAESQTRLAAGAVRLVLQTEEDNDAALRLYTDRGYSAIEGYRSLALPLSDGRNDAREEATT